MKIAFPEKESWYLNVVCLFFSPPFSFLSRNALIQRVFHHSDAALICFNTLMHSSTEVKWILFESDSSGFTSQFIQSNIRLYRFRQIDGGNYVTFVIADCQCSGNRYLSRIYLLVSAQSDRTISDCSTLWSSFAFRRIIIISPWIYRDFNDLFLFLLL